MESIHHYSVIAIKFTVSPMFPYLGCAAFLHLSIINQGKISPSRGIFCSFFWAILLVQQSSALGSRAQTGLVLDDPQCTHSWTFSTAYGSRFGIRTNTETIGRSRSQRSTYVHTLASSCTQTNTQDPGRSVRATHRAEILTIRCTAAHTHTHTDIWAPCTSHSSGKKVNLESAALSKDSFLHY